MRLTPTLGIALLLVGLVGIVLPILPGIPFLVAGAFVMAANRPGLRRRLRNHERIAPFVDRFTARDAQGLTPLERLRLRLLAVVSAVLPRK